jgi:hypothetical protein
MTEKIQLAADRARAASGLPTYAELVCLVLELHKWQELMGGWESPVWAEVKAKAETLAAANTRQGEES